MGFRQGSFAKVWSLDRNEKYSVGNLTISRKKQDGEGYETEFQDGYVRFVGNAHEALKGLDIPKSGLSIKIASCDVTNRYDPEKKKVYTNFVVFGLEIPERSEQGSKSASKAESKPQSGGKTAGETATDDELPF